MIFEVEETGELIEVTDPDFNPQEDSVYIFISTYDKRCYLWFGSSSGVRKQFIAANEGRKIKMDTAYSTCNVQHEGEEESFEEALESWRDDLKNGVQPSPVAIEQRERIAEMNTDNEAPFSTPAGEAPPMRTSKVRKSSSPTPVVTEEVIEVAIKEVPKKTQITKILKKLSKLQPIEDHVRDYIVTAGHIYSTTEVGSKVEVELLQEVKDGVFEVDNYRNRYFLEDSNLIAVEMWRIPK